MDSLRTDVLRTLAWFDLVQYPLTTFECWWYLYTEGATVGNTSVATVEQILRELAQTGVVYGDEGFWQLADRPPYRRERIRRARLAITKRRRAFWGARLLGAWPFIRFVGLVNTVALGVPQQGSDIDLFIVTVPGRLFLGRLTALLITHVLGWRQHHAHIRDRLCLSFFVAEDSLNLQPYVQADDPYLRFWVASLVPLYDAGSVYASFLKENAWVCKLLPNWCATTRWYGYWERNKQYAKPAVAIWYEAMARWLQESRLRRFLGTQLHDGGTAVVLSSQVLKLHVNDRRQVFARAWRARLAGLGLP